MDAGSRCCLKTPVRSLAGLFIVIVSLAALSGCDKADPPGVVLYVSADEHIAREVIQKFEQQSGIVVNMVGDTEARKTTGLVQRLQSEASQPQADVFWSSEVFMTIDLAEEGLLAPFESPKVAEWPMQWRDAERRWYGIAARARVIVYSPDRVPADMIPKTWMDLTQSRFKDRIVMADPRFGTTGGHLGAMKLHWDREVIPGYFNAWLEGLAENNIRLLPSGNAGVVEAVARGEADVGMTDTDDLWAAQARGLKVELVYARHSSDAEEPEAGTLLIPNTVAMVKGGPNPERARQLMEFLLSEQVERLLAESDSRNVPLRPELASLFPDLRVPDPLRIDFKLAADLRGNAVRSAMQILDGRAGQAEPATSQPTEQPE